MPKKKPRMKTYRAKYYKQISISRIYILQKGKHFDF